MADNAVWNLKQAVMHLVNRAEAPNEDDGLIQENALSRVVNCLCDDRYLALSHRGSDGHKHQRHDCGGALCGWLHGDLHFVGIFLFGEGCAQHFPAEKRPPNCFGGLCCWFGQYTVVLSSAVIGEERTSDDNLNFV